MKRRISALLLICALFMGNLNGCTSARTTDLMTGVQASGVKTSIHINGTEAASVTDFGVRLLQENVQEGENVLLSPLSVLCALAMTGNGAKGETLSQMETVFGMDLATLNRYLYAYAKSLPQEERYQLTMANSIWFRDDEQLSVEPDFLQANANWYGAGIYKTPFDNTACEEINRWVDTHTGGMIDRVLDRIPDEAMLYLINALAFDAEWQSVYEESQVRTGTFTMEDGKTQTVDFMNSEESRYLEDENAVGFVKYYADKKYAFAALLPNENLSVSEYVQGLTGEGLHSMLKNAEATPVYVSIPKFESEYAVSLSESLQTMGMTDAFHGDTADLSAMGSYGTMPLYINDVIHKTFISVDERGTKAGAVTSVEINAESAAPETEVKEVRLTRPFVYMIIDCEALVPVFIGTAMSVA